MTSVQHLQGTLWAAAGSSPLLLLPALAQHAETLECRTWEFFTVSGKMMVYMVPVMLLKATHSYLAVSRVRGIWKTEGRYLWLVPYHLQRVLEVGSIKIHTQEAAGQQILLWPKVCQYKTIPHSYWEPIIIRQRSHAWLHRHQAEIKQKKTLKNRTKQREEQTRTQVKMREISPTHPDFMERWYSDVYLPYLADTGPWLYMCVHVHVCTC